MNHSDAHPGYLETPSRLQEGKWKARASSDKTRGMRSVVVFGTDPAKLGDALWGGVVGTGEERLRFFERPGRLFGACRNQLPSQSHRMMLEGHPARWGGSRVASPRLMSVEACG